MKKTLFAIALLLVSTITFAQTEKKTKGKEQVAAQTTKKESETKLIQAGEKCPDFTFTTVDGNLISIADLKGKYVLVDIWATWCPPCKREIPHFKKLEERMKGKKIHFMSVSVDNDRAEQQWKDMIKELSMGGIQVRLDKNNTEFSKIFDARYIPHFLLLDKKGRVVQTKMELRPSSGDEIYDYLMSLKGI